MHGPRRAVLYLDRTAGVGGEEADDCVVGPGGGSATKLITVLVGSTGCRVGLQQALGGRVDHRELTASALAVEGTPQAPVNTNVRIPDAGSDRPAERSGRQAGVDQAARSHREEVQPDDRRAVEQVRRCRRSRGSRSRRTSR